MRAAVLGRPVSHSLSPLLHRTAWAALGLTGWTYDALDTGPAELPARLAAVRAGGWAGLSVTMPLKEAAARLVDELDPVAAALGVVNTVTPTPSGLKGFNTDVDGVRTALGMLTPVGEGPVAVLGAGGTARAVLAALPPGPVRLVVRDPAKALHRAGLTVFPWAPGALDGCSLVVSTVPAGAPTDVLGVCTAPLLDVLYDPWPTPLAAAATGPVVGGLAVLVGQALGQVALMTGLAVTPAVAALVRAAGEGALARRPSGRGSMCSVASRPQGGAGGASMG